MSLTPSTPASTLIQAGLSRGNTLPIPAAKQSIKIDPNAPLVSLNKLLNLIAWLNTHTTHLPLQLAITVKDYVATHLEHYRRENADIDNNPEWEKCNTAFQQLTTNLPVLIPGTVWAPTVWTPQNNTESLYTVFNVTQPHHIQCENKIVECKKGSNARDVAFNILPLSTSEKKTKASDSSVLALAHLLIAHIDTYPGAVIQLSSEKDCPYHHELNQYLHAYAHLYHQIHASLSFKLQWKTGEALLQPADAIIQKKIKAIMACEHLPNFAKLQFEAPETGNIHNISPRP